jgi:hypothetical protein
MSASRISTKKRPREGSAVSVAVAQKKQMQKFEGWLSSLPASSPDVIEARKKACADEHATRTEANRKRKEAKKIAVDTARASKISDRAEKIEKIRRLPLPKRIESIASEDPQRHPLDFYPLDLVEGTLVEIGRVNRGALGILFSRARGRKKGPWKVWANSLAHIATAVSEAH